jgi:cell division protein FtsB
MSPRRTSRLPSRRIGLGGLVKIAVVAAVPCLIWYVANLQALDTHRRSRGRRDYQRAQVEELKAEIAALEAEKAQLEAEAGSESAARDRCRLVRPGERIIYLEWSDGLLGSEDSGEK